MVSRTTDPSLNLQQLQALVVDAERIGFQLVSLVAAEHIGVHFNLTHRPYRTIALSQYWSPWRWV
jgi:hypothetical protein